MATNAELAASMLRDAAEFFRSVGKQNPNIAKQMNINAEVYEDIAGLVETDPTGVVPEDDILDDDAAEGDANAPDG